MKYVRIIHITSSGWSQSSHMRVNRVCVWMKRVFSTAACRCGSSTCWFRQVFDISKLKSYRSRLLFWKGITMKTLTSHGRAGNGSVKVNLHGTCCKHFTLASGPSVVFFSEIGLLSKTRHYKPWQQKISWWITWLVVYIYIWIFLVLPGWCFQRTDYSRGEILHLYRSYM